MNYLSHLIRPLLSALLAGLSACGDLRQAVVLPDLAVEPSRLTVACFIAPQDTLLSAIVARSRPLLDTDATRNVLITNARVTLSDGSRTVVLPHDAAVGYYRLSAAALPVRAGQTYTLTVETPDGQRVTATATVPQPVPMTALTLDSAGADGRLAVRVGWASPAAGPNYYRLRGQLRLRQADTLTLRPVVFAGNDVGLLTDAGTAPGSVVEGPVGYVDKLSPTEARPASGQRNEPLAEIMIELLHTDEAYYRYHLALTQQRGTVGNPFAEPVPIPTNIVGGLGCFGATNRAIRSLRLR